MKLEHIEDLKVFVQTVDSGNMAAAGRIIGLSPTLVSRRLARLEDAVSVRLIDRNTRRLRITDEGRSFYARCRRILNELELAEEELKPQSAEVNGLVRLALPTTMLPYGILDNLKNLLAEHPLLNLQIQLSDQPVDLLAGGWDIATHIGTPKDSSHIGRRLGEISPRLAASPEYLSKHGIPERPSDLSNHQCIRFAGIKTQKSWPIIDRNGESLNVPIGGRLICHEIITLYTAVCAGLGIGLLPRATLTKAEEEGTLTQVLPGCRVNSNTLYALIPAGRQKLPRIRVVSDWLAMFIKTLDAPSEL